MSDMDDEKIARFIEVVHSNACLWSVTSKAYKNKVLRDELWTSIGVDFDISGDEAYSLFRRLREKYRRESEKQQGRSGAAATRPSTWPHLKSLAFLDEAYRKRSVKNTQAWKSTESLEILDAAVEDESSVALNCESPIEERSKSRAHSKTPGRSSAMVEALDKNTEKMLEILQGKKQKPAFLSFVEETYNDLPSEEGKEFEREVLSLCMKYKYK